MPISVHEVADSQRSVRWILSRAVGTLGRRTHDHRVLFLLVVVACGAVLAGAFVAGIWIFLAVVVMILAAALLPVARQLGRGRVWEAWLTTPDGSHRIGGWVIAVPHPRDRDTWRIDIVQDPRHPASSGWAHAVLPALHYAADVHGAALQAADLSDAPTLLRSGYRWATTPLRRRPFLYRPHPDRAARSHCDPVQQLYRRLVEHPQDLTVISRLADEILDRLPRVRDEADRWSWEDYVLRRTAPAWQLARACALCLDSYVEGLAGGHMGLRAQAGADQDHRERLEQLIQGLLAVSETLRDAIDRRTAEVEARGKQPLLWAQRLTALEHDALVLSGLTASGRLRSGVSLGLLDDRSIEVVRDAAGRVRDDARATRRSTWFDSEAVSAWAAAIAYDALELCGSRLARVGLRRSIGVLEANSMRKLTVTQTGQARYEDVDHGDMATRWRAYLGDEMNQPAGEVRLATLSATRNQRVGMTRGAEGLRAKQFRSTIVELITNLAIIVVIGTIAWLLVALLIHPMLFARAVIRTFSVGALLGGAGPADGGWTWSRLLHFGVGSELSRDATIGLLAVVLTGAVAVAVASPRESSIMAWSQDRAWQVFVVAVGHIASVAALVLALSRMPSWRGAAPEARPEIAAGLVFALLCAASAASMSAMQSRLDEWQQRRRLLLAEARLRRAHVRLGPSPRPTRLVLAGIGCFGLCFGWTFVPAALLTVGLVLDPSAGYTAGDAAVELVTYTVLNVVPMAAIGVLFTVRWVSAWGLSGRVAVTVAALSAVVVVLMLVPLGVVTSYLVEEPAGDDSSVAKTVVVIVFAVALSLPAALFTVFLVVARVNAFRTHAATGPATFVLHIALRLGWRNFQKQRDELDLSRESG